MQTVCAWCEQQFNVKVTGSDVSHGICPRHLIELSEQIKDMMRKANLSEKDIETRLELIRHNTNNQKQPAPDMEMDGIPSNSVSTVN